MARTDTSASSSSAVIRDPQRLAALRATNLLDSGPEESFERLTRLASRDLHAPVALISLADDHRQYFKSARGLLGSQAALREMPLANSLCEKVVGLGERLVISDANRHVFAGASREARDLHLVAYLGVPLITPERQPLGTFCVADFKARDWTAAEIERLSDLAATAVHEIAMRRSAVAVANDAASPASGADIRGFMTEQRLRQLLKVARAGLWSWDVASDRHVWSSELNELLGRHGAAEPLSGAEYIAQFVHPDDRSFVESMYADLVSGQEPSRRLDIEYRIVRQDGAIAWINCVGYLERDEAGRPACVFGIDRDISSRKLAELAHLHSDRFIRKIAAVAPYHMHVFDLDENRYVYRNSSLRALLGYERAGEEDDAVLEASVWHPEDRGRRIERRRRLLELDDDGIAEWECRFRRADGDWSWYLMRSAVFARNSDGSVRQVVGTMTDITELKRTESELRRLNAELEQRVEARTRELSMANRELDSFAYTVSHDLRAPLRVISGFGSVLIERCASQLDAEGKQDLERINEAARRMHALVDALLHLSRASSGQLSLESVDLSMLARRVVAELARSEPGRSMDIVIEDNVTATSDPVLLRVVMENLLDNAWKFTAQSPRPRIEFGMECGRHGQSFFVRDNGIGFDMEHATRLFAPFQRLPGATGFSGTGIGLATVQRVITRLGGRIWAQSAPGAGATFYFTLGTDR